MKAVVDSDRVDSRFDCNREIFSSSSSSEKRCLLPPPWLTHWTVISPVEELIEN